MVTQSYTEGVGRRKEAVAQVRLVPGDGSITINGKPLEVVLPIARHQMAILEPFKVVDALKKYDVVVKIQGGGISGWAGAIRQGIARALVELNEEQRSPLRKAGLLTRDPRVKERKKYGLRRARKAKQYTKR